MSVENEISPFKPNSTDPGMFVGREEEFQTFNQSAVELIAGRTVGVLVMGTRGIGKSTLSKKLTDILKARNVLPFCVDLSPLKTFEEFPAKIQETLFIETRNNNNRWKNIGQKMFATLKRVDRVSLPLLNFRFNDEEKREFSSETLMKNNIIHFVRSVTENEGKNGFALILDNINGLARDFVFSNFLKGMMEEFDRIDQSFPFMLIINVVPENWRRMVENQESLPRVFSLCSIILKELEKDLVKQFYKQNFEDADLNIDNEALELLVKHSRGYPMFMQQIGYRTFWIAKNEMENIDISVAKNGIKKAMYEIGGVYFPKQLKTITSKKYLPLLKRKEFKELGRTHRRRDIEKIRKEMGLSEGFTEDFLSKMIKTEVLVEEGQEPGTYRFKSELMWQYIDSFCREDLTLEYFIPEN